MSEYTPSDNPQPSSAQVLCLSEGVYYVQLNLYTGVDMTKYRPRDIGALRPFVAVNFEGVLIKDEKGRLRVLDQVAFHSPTTRRCWVTATLVDGFQLDRDQRLAPVSLCGYTKAQINFKAAEGIGESLGECCCSYCESLAR